MKRLTIFVLSAATLTLSACAVTTAGIEGGDRSMSRSLNDVTAHRAITSRVERAYDHNLRGIDIEVAEGIAVLSGFVPSETDREEAERIAWSAPYIVEVGNEIEIGKKQDFISNHKDGFLRSSIRTRMIADKSVNALNYNIETHEGKVILLGVAESPEELERAAHIASTTKGAKEVVSYVRLAGETPKMIKAAQNGTSFPTPRTSSAPSLAGPPVTQPAPNTPPSTTPSYPQSTSPTPDAPSGSEPYYRDPTTGERIILPPGTKTVPFDPNRDAPFYIDPDTGGKIQVVYETTY